MGIIPFLLAQATVATDGTITLGTGEVSAVTDVLENGASSILSIFMQFRPAILILGIVTIMIGFILSKVKGK